MICPSPLSSALSKLIQRPCLICLLAHLVRFRIFSVILAFQFSLTFKVLWIGSPFSAFSFGIAGMCFPPLPLILVFLFLRAHRRIPLRLWYSVLSVLLLATFDLVPIGLPVAAFTRWAASRFTVGAC